MVFQKRLAHLLVWVTCDSLLRKRMLLHSHTHQPIKCKHAFFKYLWVKLWNDTCLQKSPRGGGGFHFLAHGLITVINDFNMRQVGGIMEMLSKCFFGRVQCLRSKKCNKKLYSEVQQKIFCRWQLRGSFVFFWLLTFWSHVYWCYLTRTSVRAFLKLGLVN